MGSCNLSAGVSILTTLTFSIFIFTSGSVIKVEKGSYKRITVKVNDDVSSCHCDPVIENIQVRSITPLLVVHYLFVSHLIISCIYQMNVDKSYLI